MNKLYAAVLFTGIVCIVLSGCGSQNTSDWFQSIYQIQDRFDSDNNSLTAALVAGEQTQTADPITLSDISMHIIQDNLDLGKIAQPNQLELLDWETKLHGADTRFENTLQEIMRENDAGQISPGVISQLTSDSQKIFDLEFKGHLLERKYGVKT